VVPETWYTFSEKNKMMAEQAMAESQRLREAIFHTIEQTSNDLRYIYLPYHRADQQRSQVHISSIP
jgi:Tektin family